MLSGYKEVNANYEYKTMIKVIILFSSFLCLSRGADAARILGVFVMPGRSHFTCNLAIMKSLHDAGHHITMIAPFSDEEKMENFTYVDSHFDSNMLNGNSILKKDFGRFLEFLTSEGIDICCNVMKMKEIQEALRSQEKLYDVMFVEVLSGYECYSAIAEKLQIPLIGTVTLHATKLADDYIGMPRSPALMPLYLDTAELEMDFFERVTNLWNNFVYDYYCRIRMSKKLKQFYREHFGEEDTREKEISLIFYNNHPTFLSRPIPPNVMEIGGIHLKPPNPLSKSLKKFIDEASHGVILFTLGSIIKASSLRSEQTNAFLAAFATIPQRVIWKYEEPIENLPKNIMLSSWLPQRDILEHEKVIAFMSHCGQSGTYEAIVTGTPVVAIPIFFDQPINAFALKRRGVAVSLDLESVTKEKVLIALNTIINDTGYFERMQALSRAFKDRPMSPQESIVYWTEYVIRHNGTRYLKALGAEMPFYKYFMLDIVALAFTIASLVTYVIYRTVRYFCILFLSPSIYAVSMKKSQ